MSSLLYTLGNWAIRAKVLVLLLWVAVLAIIGSAAGILQQGANAPISIPGTESQAGLDMLSHNFPEVTGTGATILVVAPAGAAVTDEPYSTAITETAAKLTKLPKVLSVTTPFSELAPSEVSSDKRATMISLKVDAETGQAPQATVDGIKKADHTLRKALPADAQVSYGGELFSVAVPTISITEGVGVLIAFVVLILTLGSLLAAGMPLLIAVVGVAISVAGIFLSTAIIEIPSTTPMLALMLGLAVGIDYTLFIVSRHQEQLRAGIELKESIARATATSGSAVVFAGVTVIIALLGLTVANVPFLSALGVAAACGVAIAVIIAVTLTPAILAMAGLKILPRKQRRLLSESAPQLTSRADKFFARWVRVVTAKPLATVLVVLITLSVAALPALHLRLALPGADSLPEGDPARTTYELTAKHFGAGANGPLLLTGSIISSTDPLKLMSDMAAEVREIPGVAAVPLSTPNRSADTGLLQIIPEAGPHAESTTQLVHTLRAKHAAWEKKYGVSFTVTGYTAVAIDVSNLLLGALVPFGLLVVGLSLVLLAMVFRSVWVPIKATLGYLLSVGSAFGAVVAVFQWGWFANILNVDYTGPVLNFMPIILMGVLFGLAMDYEVFLVSRIREEVVHGTPSRKAIRSGFIGSGRVVTAAAIIMFAVFAAFVPEGDPSIKVIALGLAVGVFVDAFIVRMTLVPAVLQLLGDRAWRMPAWLDKRLPTFDVEGEGLAKEIAYAAWPADAPESLIASEDVILRDGQAVPQLRIAADQALLLSPGDPLSLPLAEAISGRSKISGGVLKVGGYLLPERAGSIRRRSAWATPQDLTQVLQDRPRVLILDLRGWKSVHAASGAADMLSKLSAYQLRLAAATAQRKAARAAKQRPGQCILVVLGDSALAEQVLPSGITAVQLFS